MAGEPEVPYPYDRSVLLGEEPELGLLLHRLNNQLGVILANAELLETKLIEHSGRSRANQIVTGAVEAVATARDIRSRIRHRAPNRT